MTCNSGFFFLVKSSASRPNDETSDSKRNLDRPQQNVWILGKQRPTKYLQTNRGGGGVQGAEGPGQACPGERSSWGNWGAQHPHSAAPGARCRGARPGCVSPFRPLSGEPGSEPPLHHGGGREAPHAVVTREAPGQPTV